MYAPIVLLTLLAAAAQAYDDTTVAVLVDSEDSILLPDSYAWLQVQLKEMIVGGATPELSEEQWLELQVLMSKDDFDRLSNLLLGGANTAVHFDWSTVSGIPAWFYEKTTGFYDKFHDENHYHDDDEYYDDDYLDYADDDDDDDDFEETGSGLEMLVEEEENAEEQLASLEEVLEGQDSSEEDYIDELEEIENEDNLENEGEYDSKDDAADDDEEELEQDLYKDETPTDGDHEVDLEETLDEHFVAMRGDITTESGNNVQPTGRRLIPLQTNDESKDWTVLIVVAVVVAVATVAILLGVCICRKNVPRGDYRKFENLGGGALYADEKKVPPV